MPSVSTSFLYSLITMLIVGTILTFSMIQYVNPLREMSEVNSLKDILNNIAGKAEECLVTVTEYNATSSIVVKLPLAVGNRDYWIRFSNDSSKAWLECGFGRPGEIVGQTYRVYLSRAVSASGIFEGRYEFALLNCSLSGYMPELILGDRGET